VSASTQPTLILLHGATLNGHMWDPMRRDLDARWRVIAPDLPGHGARRQEAYTLAGAIATVEEAARSVAPAPIVVGGDSLGGYSTLASAASLPQDRLKGLILCGSSSNITGPALRPYLFQIALFRVMSALIGEQRLIRKHVPKQLLRSGLKVEDVDAMLKAGISLKVFRQAVYALRDIDFRAKLAAVEQPVMIVNGTKDKGHMRQETSFVEVTRHPTVHHLEGCEHGVTILRPRAVALMFNDFAARVFA
jgi:pimeloyl-ACP methyl ester carboxylesterase